MKDQGERLLLWTPFEVRLIDGDSLLIACEDAEELSVPVIYDESSSSEESSEDEIKAHSKKEKRRKKDKKRKEKKKEKKRRKSDKEKILEKELELAKAIDQRPATNAWLIEGYVVVVLLYSHCHCDSFKPDWRCSERDISQSYFLDVKGACRV